MIDLILILLAMNLALVALLYWNINETANNTISNATCRRLTDDEKDTLVPRKQKKFGRSGDNDVGDYISAREENYLEQQFDSMMPTIIMGEM